jgi:hypothetical protein
MVSSRNCLTGDQRMAHSGHADRGNYVLSVGIGVLGIAALAISAIANTNFASTLAPEGLERDLSAGSSLAIDASALVFALAAGALWTLGRHVSSIGIAVIALACGVYSWASLIGHGSVSRIAPSVQAVETAKADAAASAEAGRMAQTRWSEHRDWLRARAKDRSIPKSERSAAVDALSAHMATPVAGWSESGAVTVTAQVAADPQAVVLSRLAERLGISVSPEAMQIGLVVAVSTLLVAIKLGGGFAAGALWPRRSEEDVVDVEAEEFDAEPVAIAAQAAPAGPSGPPPGTRSATANLISDDNVVPFQLRPEPTQTAADQVARFFSENTKESASPHMASGQAYQRYVSWALDQEMEVASVTQFGLVATQLGVRKSNMRGRVHYYLQWGDVPVAGEAPQVAAVA